MLATPPDERTLEDVSLPEAVEGFTKRRVELVQRAVKEWTAALIDLGGRNNLLRFRDLKAGTLNLTNASPTALAALLQGKAIKTSTLFADPEERQRNVRRLRNVPDSEKHQVEVEYVLAPKGYGSTLEIDHIVSLELGGSNDIANLFPERVSPAPGFRVKDKLENKLHDLVCAGSMSLHAAQVGIATNWRGLYKTVYGATP